MVKSIPIEYKKKETLFLNRHFYIDSRVHIPRPSTEFITKHYIKSINDYKHDITVAEIGTGSGVIAISCVLECINIEKAYAIDLQKTALEVAEINRKRFNVGDKLEIIQSDVLTEILDKRIDLFLVNLPFADEEKMRNLRPEVRKFEPLSALYGGKTGFELYDKFFEQMKPYKYLGNVVGVWVYAYKKHLPQVLKWKEEVFPKHKFKQIEDPKKPNYLHCFIHK